MQNLIVFPNPFQILNKSQTLQQCFYVLLNKSNKLFLPCKLPSQTSTFNGKYSIDRFKTVQNMLAKYEQNDMTKFWLGPVLFVFINEPNLVRQVLNSQDCLEKSFTYKFLRLDKGLLAAKRK